MKRRSFLQKLAAASAMMVCGVASILAEVKPKTLLGADLPSYEDAPYEEVLFMADGSVFRGLRARRFTLIKGKLIEVDPLLF